MVSLEFHQNFVLVLQLISLASALVLKSKLKVFKAKSLNIKVDSHNSKNKGFPVPKPYTKPDFRTQSWLRGTPVLKNPSWYF